MNNWLDCCINPQALLSLYERAPSLDGIQLVTVELNRHATSLNITWLTSDFPSKLPKKWYKHSGQEVSISICLSSVGSLKIDGWSGEPVGNMQVFQDESDIVVQFQSKDCQILTRSKFLRITSIK